MSSENSRKIPPWRLYSGIALIVLSLLMPLFSVWIIASALPAWLKASLVGLVSVGGPEILAFVAVAVLGKEAFELIMGRVLGLLKRMAPSGSVSKFRYRLGLLLMILTFLPSYVVAYSPAWLPDTSPARLYVCLSADVLFVISLFVLGGDFWDKLRALFIYEARAVFPD
ncbi:MAG: hypothetical protein KC777_18710 [Cyanobacteria bacterium HKST-UBA02]|nr:hypothetical protein [Cyanobacteria bacterium HKST-UBA02]